MPNTKFDISLHAHPRREGWSLVKIAYPNDAIHGRIIGRFLSLLFGDIEPTKGQRE